jgi:hypothetical protein
LGAADVERKETGYIEAFGNRHPLGQPHYYAGGQRVALWANAVTPPW